VQEAIGVMSARRLGSGLILRALVDDLAVVHVELVCVHGLPAGDRGDMQVLDAMQVGQRKGKTFALFRRDKLVDVDRMNWLLALVIATTVAKGFPASGETGEKDISHDSHPHVLCLNRPQTFAPHQAASAFGTKAPYSMIADGS
jgi:hypothetical protein